MTTTDHHNKLSQHTGAGQNENVGDVVAFDTIKQRNRLDQLLFTRSHLASIAAQQRSHDMDEAHESFLTLCAVESQIREEFPREYESSYARWLATEVADEHPVGVLTPGCGICASIASYCGVNILPPEAA